MKKLFLILLTLLFTLCAHAVWKVEEVELDVVPCPNKSCYISQSCLVKNKNCEAMKAYKKPFEGTLGPHGANPGSEVCKKKFNGAVNIARDEEGNESAFCVFEDKSMISLSGVWK